MATPTTRPPAGLTRRDLARLRFARWRYRRGELHDGRRPCPRCYPLGLPSHLDYGAGTWCSPVCPQCGGSGWVEDVTA